MGERIELDEQLLRLIEDGDVVWRIHSVSFGYEYGSIRSTHHETELEIEPDSVVLEWECDDRTEVTHHLNDDDDRVTFYCTNREQIGETADGAPVYRAEWKW